MTTATLSTIAFAAPAAPVVSVETSPDLSAMNRVGLSCVTLLTDLLPLAGQGHDHAAGELATQFHTLAEYLRQQKGLPDAVTGALLGMNAALQLHGTTGQVMTTLGEIVARYRDILIETEDRLDAAVFMPPPLDEQTMMRVVMPFMLFMGERQRAVHRLVAQQGVVARQA